MTPAVWVAALGYFVDIFDLLLFSIVRKPSLASLGLGEEAQVSTGILLHNLQMIGMLLGGVLWGMLGDRKGRLSVLFGSIFLYSIGNIANAFVWDVPSYAICRVVSGLGLAGELGAGITLVAETLSRENRGFGTMIVATVGVSGAVVAGLVGEVFDWRITYGIGGALGFLLLLLRINTAESLLFKNSEAHAQPRGSLRALFLNRERLFRFLNCVLIGVPIWYVIGILIQLSPELGKALGLVDPVTAGRSVMFCYAGLVVGDFMSGYLSQVFRSRTRIVVIFIGGTALSALTYFTLGRGATGTFFYAVCGLLGFFAGYWAVFVTIAAEQFGTNLRATVATSAPNFVRASVVPMSISFALLKPTWGPLAAAQWVGGVVLFVAVLAAFRLRDTFGRDLEFYEQVS
jgi:putative MFS transporter